MSRDVTAVIQARSGSTRLPGKILRSVMGQTILEHVVQRVRAASNVQQVVVATTELPEDDVVASLAAAAGARVTRGSEGDVLDRFLKAFREHGGAIGVRVTSDCPCLDPRLLEEMVRRFVEQWPELDYLSNAVVRSYPRGYDLEVFRVDALRDAALAARDPSSREHVTPFLYRNPAQFRIAHLTRDDPAHTADWRLTLDEEADWRVIRRLFEELWPTDPCFGLEAVEQFLSVHPALLRENASVTQKAH